MAQNFLYAVATVGTMAVLLYFNLKFNNINNKRNKWFRCRVGSLLKVPITSISHASSRISITTSGCYGGT
eukprot:1644032-Rhodomonas_salina.1